MAEDQQQTLVPVLAGLLLAGTNTFLVDELKKRGIDDIIPAHGSLLVHLFGGNALTLTELAERARRTKSTVSVLVGKLEKAGYLYRKPDPRDGRVILLQLTTKGEGVQEAFLQITQEMHRRIIEELGQRELAVLEALLAKCVQVFDPQLEDEFSGPMANA